MPASLSVLPFEIINQIISNVEKSAWLLEVALACRSLHTLTIPHLYSDVEPFTIHVLSNPELASHVRSFTLSDCWGTSEDTTEAGDSDSVDDAVRAVVHKFSQSSEEEGEWIDDLKSDGGEDAYLCLLLPSLPNLERLDLLVPEMAESCTKYFSIVIMQRVPTREKPFDEQLAFSSLKAMINNCNADKYGQSPDLMSSFLKLPSLREYYCQKVGSSEDDTDEGLAKLETASTSLTHLEVRESKLNIADLTNLLRACKALRTLVYELGWGHISYCDYSTPQLRQALASTENSLENLWLDYVPGKSYWVEGDREELDPIGSLSKFEHLKNLKVGMYVFFGVADANSSGLENAEIDVGDASNTVNLANTLPASIETLYFSHTNGRIRILTRALEILLQQKLLSTPKLRRIAFEAYITGNDERFDFSRLDALSKEIGVSIDRIDGTAVPADNGIGWEYSPGVDDRGQGMDGSLKWAAEVGTVRGSDTPVYVNAGK